MVMTEQPPWSAQCQLVDQLQAIVSQSSDKTKIARAQSQLAAIYHVGYGVKHNDSLALRHLQDPNKMRPVDKALYKAVSEALQTLIEQVPSSYPGDESAAAQTTFMPLRPTESRIHRNTFDEMLPLIPAASSSLLTEQVQGDEDGPTGALSSLTAACRIGDLDAARKFAKQPIHSLDEPDKPNFLH